MTKDIILTVPSDFVLPSVFLAGPADVARLLTLASSIPSFLNDKNEKNEAECVAEAVAAALRSKSEEELTRLRDKLSSNTAESTRLKEELAATRANATEAARILVATELEEERANTKRAENTVCDLLQKQIEMTNTHHSETASLQETIIQLKDQKAELITPTGLGRSGELDVVRILQESGFIVEDTTQKHAGYLDLIVTKERQEGLRLAVEVKNKNPLKRCDLDEFREKSLVLFREGKAEGSLIISLRAHTKTDDIFELVMDSGGRPVASIGWLGAEKCKRPDPLTREQIETMVHVQFSLMEKCMDLRRDLSDTKDSDVLCIQETVQSLADGLGKSLDGLAEQSRLADKLKANVNNQRVQLIHSFHTLWKADRDVPWLGCGVNAPWMDNFLTALSQAQTMKDSDIWNRMARSKALVERTIGRDALFQSVREFKRQREE